MDDDDIKKSKAYSDLKKAKSLQKIEQVARDRLAPVKPGSPKHEKARIAAADVRVRKARVKVSSAEHNLLDIEIPQAKNKTKPKRP